MIAIRSCLVRFSLGFTAVHKKLINFFLVFQVHPYEYQKQKGDMALTSRATGFGTRDPKSKRIVDTIQAAIGSVEIQSSIDTIHPSSIDNVHPMSIDAVQPTSIDTI